MLVKVNPIYLVMMQGFIRGFKSRLHAGQRSLPAIASRSIRPELMAEGRRGGRTIGP
jgi:hypothetical protein